MAATDKWVLHVDFAPGVGGPGSISFRGVGDAAKAPLTTQAAGFITAACVTFTKNGIDYTIPLAQVVQMTISKEV